MLLVERGQVDDRLRYVDARVEHVEGTDDRVWRREAVRFEIDNLPALAHPGRKVGQQIGEGAPARAGRAGRGFLLKKKTEVGLQRPLYGVGRRQLQRLSSDRPRAHAAEERIRWLLRLLRKQGRRERGGREAGNHCPKCPFTRLRQA